MGVVLKQVGVSLLLSYAFGRLFASSLAIVWTIVVSFVVIYGSIRTCWMELPGKNPTTGKIPFMRVLLFLPYYGAVFLLMIGGKFLSVIRSWSSVDQILPGIYLGDFYSSFLSTKKWVGVVDLTNELPRLSNSKNYLNIPAWDGCPPTVENIERAVNFVISGEKPVLIHCAYVNMSVFITIRLGTAKAEALPLPVPFF